MNISIIGTLGIPATYGGFETLAHYLSNELRCEHKIIVYCTAIGKKIKPKYFNGVRLRYLYLKANGAQSMLYDFLSMLYAVPSSDVILLLGVSGCIFLPIIKLLFKGVLIVNIDGIEWKRDKWNFFIRYILKKSEQLAVNYATSVVSDNEEIRRYIDSAYNKKSVMIPYGADHVNNNKLTEAMLKDLPFLLCDYAFTVCRIEPENNVDLILDVFSQVAFNFIIVGNWNNSAFGMRIKKKYMKFENIHLLNPIYDQEKLNQIRSNAKVYIHGHSAGGTNPSLVEAMYLGLPIFAFDVMFNRETTDNSACYFKDRYDLIKLIQTVNKDELRLIGQKLQFVAAQKYTWKRIADEYNRLFKMNY
jgi:glycosyltransferase involved in cell wall biosynthesis